MVTFIETKLFTKLVQNYFTDDAYAALQSAIMANPEAGDVIPGSGAVPKLRWGLAGRGKRGGVRVIYYLRLQQGQVWMLTLYAKNEAATIAGAILKKIRRSLMAKTKRNVGQEILDGIRQIKRGEHGRVANVPSLTRVREQTGLSQLKFATLLGVSVRTLQEWEQGRRAPSGAARTLLLIAAKNPRALTEVA